MANASVGIAEAFRLKDSMMDTAASEKTEASL